MTSCVNNIRAGKWPRFNICNEFLAFRESAGKDLHCSAPVGHWYFIIRNDSINYEAML